MKLSTGRFWSRLAVAFVVVLLSGIKVACGQEGASHDVQGAAPIKVAVVDVDKVLSQSEAWSDSLDEYQRLHEQMRRSLEKQERQVRVLRAECENAPPGTDAAVEKRARLEAALREYEERRGEFEQKLHDQRIGSLSRLFNEISDIIRSYAVENKVDLVLRKQDLTVSPSQPVELEVVVTTAHVLYARESYDMTDAIVRELDARYPGEVRER